MIRRTLAPAVGAGALLLLAGAAPATATHAPVTIDVRIEIDDRGAPGPLSPMLYAVEDIEITAGPELTPDDLVANESSLPCAGVTVDLDRSGEVVVAWDGTEPSCPVRLVEVTIIGHPLAGPYVVWDRLLGVPTPGEEPVLDPGDPEPEAPVLADLGVFIGDFATVLTWTGREEEQAFLVGEAWFRFGLADHSGDDDGGGTDDDGGSDGGGTDGGGDDGGDDSTVDDGGPDGSDGGDGADGGDGSTGGESGTADPTPAPAPPATPTTATPTYTG
ncbi:MAG: hypothetical protein H5T83_03485 [Actinotalea sp.]|nr:hypothetical protein [Actinotalea sp.]